MIFVGVLSALAVVTLHDEVNAATPGLGVAADSLIAVKDWTFLLGPGFMASLNALCLAPVMYRSGLVPRIIPTLGLIGFPLLFASDIGVLFGSHDQVSTVAALLTLPIAAWELSLGVWMTVKGFKENGDTEAAAPVTPRTPAFSGATA